MAHYPTLKDLKLWTPYAVDIFKSMVYDNSTEQPTVVTTEPGEIEPTCISDIDDEGLQKPLWKMKAILEKQMAKSDFWMIDENFLLDIGRCIGDLLVAKLICISQHKSD